MEDGTNTEAGAARAEDGVITEELADRTLATPLSDADTKEMEGTLGPEGVNLVAQFQRWQGETITNILHTNLHLTFDPALGRAEYNARHVLLDERLSAGDRKRIVEGIAKGLLVGKPVNHEMTAVDYTAASIDATIRWAAETLGIIKPAIRELGSTNNTVGEKGGESHV